MMIGPHELNMRVRSFKVVELKGTFWSCVIGGKEKSNVDDVEREKEGEVVKDDWR